MSTFRRLIKEERGQIAILFALLFMVILGLAGTVIDFGILYHERRHAQNVADAAALAGAQELPDDACDVEDPLCPARSAALDYAARNGFDENDDPDDHIDVTPIVSTTVNHNDTIEVTVKNKHTGLFLAHIPFGGDRFRTVSARAVAMVGAVAIGAQPWGVVNPCCEPDAPEDLCGEFDCELDVCSEAEFGFEFDTPYMIKLGPHEAEHGSFGALRLECKPPDCGCGGTSTYCDSILDGSEMKWTQCEYACCESGNMGNNTFKCICERLGGQFAGGECKNIPDTCTWDSVFDEDGNLRPDGPGWACPNFIVIPIVKTLCKEGEVGESTQIYGFGLFFIEEIASSPEMTLMGRFVDANKPGEFAYGSLDFGLRTVRLME